MAATQPRTVLKRRPWRTSEIEAGPVPVFVKRFHDARFPGRTVGRWRDLGRARREARILDVLRAAGVPTPAVLGIESTADGVELRLEFLEGARTVADVLDRADSRLAARLGRLAARLHAAGFAHGDAHLGNVIVDAHGTAWVIDAASMTSATTSRRMRDLVRAAAESRERTTARFRARFLIAYSRAIDPARRPELGALVEAVEGAARSARREHVERESDRWLRESGVVARHEDGSLAVLARASLARIEALDLARRALAEDAIAHTRVVAGRRARIAWITHARLEEHRVPSARPLVLVESPRALAVFAEPAGSHAPRRDSAVDARAVGALAGTLFDRGFRIAPRDVAIAADGSAFVTLDPRSLAATTLDEALTPWRGEGWLSSADFVAGFGAAQRGSRLQREVVHRHLVARSGSS